MVAIHVLLHGLYLIKPIQQPLLTDLGYFTNRLSGYFEDMNHVISVGFDALCLGGMMHLVDQSAYVDIPIATDLIFVDLAQSLGFEVAAVIKCRRANTSGQQLKNLPI